MQTMKTANLIASTVLALTASRLAAEPLMSMRLRANDTDTPEIWRANFKAVAEHPGCCDEIWFSTGCGVPTLDWHRARAAVIAEAIADVRAKGIVPSLQFQATLGHGDEFGTPEMFALKKWTGWTGWQGLETKYCNCPRQAAFHAYLREVSRIYAPLGFAALWIDDDLRIGHHQPSDSYGRHIGCWCATCLKAFNAENGSNWTREALAKAVETDDALSARWRRFSVDAICRVARTIAETFRELSPETMMAFQHANTEESADQVSEVLKTLHEVSGRPVGFRPGGGSYYDDNPNGVVEKSLQTGWFRNRIGNPAYVKVWTPEIESWPRTYYSRSAQGVLAEGMTALMYGMNAMSFFVSNGAKEKPELFGRTLWNTLAEAAPVLHGYARTVAGCEAVGFVQPGQPAIGIRRAAIPVLAGVGRSVGELTKDENAMNVNSMTSDDVQKLREELDGRAGGLPAVVKSPFSGLMQVHVDASGALRCVALMNLRIADQGPVRILLRKIPAGWKSAVWNEMCRPPVRLALERTKDGAYVTVPRVGAWNGGYLAGEEPTPALVPMPRKAAFPGGVTANTNVSYRQDAALAPEAYRLTVAPDGVRIVSADAAGRFYAEQTLRQLKTDAGYVCAEIDDAPQYPWRGMLLDDCRHFFGKEAVMAAIDQMAQHKMNRLHWHLTEDQGWRLDIPGYPELVQYGAVRPESPKHGALLIRKPDRKDVMEMDGVRYGPFYYTEADVKEILAYAAERHVTVVPEIELPGHVFAALAAYPEFACVPENQKLRRPRLAWGIENDVLCIGNDKAIRFMEDVLDYVCRLFPSDVVHIGGDECPQVRWKTCPKCQARIKAEGLRDERDLQPWITKHFVKFLEARGKRALGWDEYLLGDVPKSAIGMSWREGRSGAGHEHVSGARAAIAGHDVVMTPCSYCYLDYAQALPDDPYQYIGGRVPLARCHSFDPSAGVPEEARKHILGGQGNNWSEYTWNGYDLEWKMWPRGCALAEVFWTGDARPDFGDFMRRMAVHRKRLLAAGVNCAPLE